MELMQALTVRHMCWKNCAQHHSAGTRILWMVRFLVTSLLSYMVHFMAQFGLHVSVPSTGLPFASKAVVVSLQGILSHYLGTSSLWRFIAQYKWNLELEYI